MDEERAEIHLACTSLTHNQSQTSIHVFKHIRYMQMIQNGAHEGSQEYKEYERNPVH